MTSTFDGWSMLIDFGKLYCMISLRTSIRMEDARMIRTRRLLARCPRCHGRLFFHSDQHGAYLNCLACGCVLEERSLEHEQDQAVAPALWWRAQSA
jgi:hypothetical protein